MSKAKPNGSSKEVNAELVKAISDLMAEVMKKPDAGQESKYSLTDKCKVLDRMMKIEAMRLGVHEDDAGSFFRNSGGQDDENG